MSSPLNRLAGIFLAVSGLAAGPAVAAPKALPVTTQLPRAVRPTHYDIAITPEAGALTFSGRARIAIDVLEGTPAITVNALDLEFGEVRVLGGAGAPDF